MGGLESVCGLNWALGHGTTLSLPLTPDLGPRGSVWLHPVSLHWDSVPGGWHHPLIHNWVPEDWNLPLPTSPVIIRSQGGGSRNPSPIPSSPPHQDWALGHGSAPTWPCVLGSGAGSSMQDPRLPMDLEVWQQGRGATTPLTAKFPDV